MKPVLLEVSLGEALDKLSILELKSSLIKDPAKLAEIRKEHVALLDAGLTKYRVLHELHYGMLLAVNRRIWDLTDELIAMSASQPTYAFLSYTLLEQNKERFRIKNILNQDSPLKEQKNHS